MRGIVALGDRRRASPLGDGGDRRPGPRGPGPARPALVWLSALVALLLSTRGPVGLAGPAGALTGAHHVTSDVALRAAVVPGSAPTVWLCRPGLPDDPCTSSFQTSVVEASGATSVVDPSVDAASKFDCFYVYPTVSRETTLNADLRIQKTEIVTAIAQAARFSTVCRVWAPMYRQFTLFALQALLTHGPGVTLTVLAALETSYQSLKSGFEDYLAHDNDGRPIVFIGHSQGASVLISLLGQMVDDNPVLRSRLVLAIILGGNVVVPDGHLEGGSFSHIPLCRSAGRAGCVIAYSTFPGPPPAGSLFGRPGTGVSLVTGQTVSAGVHVACVNPGGLGGGNAVLDPLFPTGGLMATPWVEYPRLYGARCQSAGGATWLEVTKISGASDARPVVTEAAGPDWGYHEYDVNLALGNLVADTAAAERSWSERAHG